MSKILVIDDMAIVREPLAAALCAAGHQVVSAVNGRGALAQVAADLPDVILLDLRMPEMDGLAFLTAIRSNPRTAGIAVILLSECRDKQSVLEIAKLGVQGYILKSQFSLPQLLERVKKYISSGGQRPAADLATNANPSWVAKRAAVQRHASTEEAPVLLSREQCMRRAEGALEGKTLSGAVAQVITAAVSPRGDAQDLAALISRDAVLSVRVLHVANSAAYARARGPVSNIEHAVRQIGASTVRNVATAVGVFDAMPPSGPNGFDPICCWQHSFAVAVLCERLAIARGASPDCEPGTAYLVGLCHDLGEILFHTHFSKEYRQVLEWQERTGRAREQLEREMLGMTHGQLVMTILQRLGLPPALREPIEVFHLAGHAGITGGAGGPLVAILGLAEAYANGALLASSALAPIGPLTEAQCRAATGMARPAAEDPAKLRSEVYGLTALLGRLSPAEEAKAMSPPFSMSGGRIWLVREARYSSFDPVAVALGSLAQVAVHERLPTREEAAQCEGLVIVSHDPAEGKIGNAQIEEAIGGATRRLLWLTEKGGCGPAGVTCTALPIPLARLAEFVQSLMKLAASHAA